MPARQHFLEGWFHPWRRGGSRVSRFFPAQKDREKKWCGRRDSNPHEPLSSTSFHTIYGFRRSDAAF